MVEELKHQGWEQRVATNDAKGDEAGDGSGGGSGGAELWWGRGG